MNFPGQQLQYRQYNPHGIFIALENVGYVLLNLAFLFLGVAMLVCRSDSGALPAGSSPAVVG